MANNKYPEPQYDYMGDLSIDKHALDEELMAQSQKMMRYNQAHAQAQFDRERAKQNLDVCKARLDSQIRADAAAEDVNLARQETEWAAKEADAKDRKAKAEVAEASGKRDEVKAARARAKLTESQVDAKIKQHPDYLEALDSYQKADYKVNLTFAGVMAMNARRPMLENLVRLYLHGYYSSPRLGFQDDMMGYAGVVETEAAIMRGVEVSVEQVAPLVVNDITPHITDQVVQPPTQEAPAAPKAAPPQAPRVPRPTPRRPTPREGSDGS